MKKLLLILMILALTLTSMVGCTKETAGDKALQQSQNEEVQENTSNYPMTITDGLGYEVTIKKRPERLVSIAPSQTEILYALGLGEFVVAVSDFCDYPLEALDKEKVGSAWTTNIEKIIELNPDIVFVYGEGQPEANEQLLAAGITLVKFMPESIQEVMEAIITVGKIMDIEARAEELVEYMQQKKDEIAARVNNQPTKRVFYQVWDEPLMTAGPGSFINELITLAGGENIAANADGPWPQFSVEALIEGDPEVYLAPSHVLDKGYLTKEEEIELKEAIAARPGFSTIHAVKNNRIELLEPNILSRPGARIIEALELLARSIHPEAFK